MRVRLIPTSRRNHLNGPHTMSTGAVTIMVHGSTGESETESDEDDTPLENTIPSGACQEARTKESPQTGAMAKQQLPILKQSVCKLERAVKQASQTMEWLITERKALTKRRSAYTKTGRRKQCRRRTALKKRIPGLRFTRHYLSVAVEKYRGILRIKKTQLQRKRDQLRRQEFSAKVTVEGLSRMCQAGDCQRGEFSEDDLSRLGEFWRGIWQQRGQHNPAHPSLLLWQQEMQDKLDSCQADLTPMEHSVAWEVALKKMKSWRAPGPDCIHAHWYKAFPRLTGILGEVVWGQLLQPRGSLPLWFVRGRTVMIPKDKGTTAPDRQRPITCLNAGYKLLTASLSVILKCHVVRANLMPPEQMALSEGTRGCQDSLAIDQAILDEVRERRRDLAVAWIDFQKAYDMVPHKWLRKVLKMISAPKVVQRAVRRLMRCWETDIEVRGPQSKL